MEKNWAQKYICGEKMTNMRSATKEALAGGKNLMYFMPRAIVVASPTNPSLVRTTNLGALDCATNIKAPPYDWKYWARIKRTHNIRIVCWSYVNCQALAYDWKYSASKVRYTNANNLEFRGLELLRYHVNHRKLLEILSEKKRENIEYKDWLSGLCELSI